MNDTEKKGIVLESVDWVWGTLEGGFNQKQAVSQIIVDAVIGMIPLVGDVTAVRDLIAVVLRLVNDPKKREEKLEWMTLTLLLFALIPVFGGAVKGVGKLVIRGAEDGGKVAAKIEDFIAVLNRMGFGDAVKWFKELDFEKFTEPVLGQFRALAWRIDKALSSVIKKLHELAPESWIENLDRIKKGLKSLVKKGEEMIPDAVKELNSKLKAIQKQVYGGHWHPVPKTLEAETREAEAHLVEVAGELKWVGKKMPFPPNSESAFIYKKGWPVLDKGKYVSRSGKKIRYEKIEAFSGEIKPVTIPEGTRIYRIVDPTNPDLGYWWTYELPASGKDWREKLAVLDSWNKNGSYLEIIVPKGGLRAWEGKAASQIENNSTKVGFGQALEGGGTQLLIDFLFPKNKKAADAIKAGLKRKPTHWVDHAGLHVPPKKVLAKLLGDIEFAAKSAIIADEIEHARANN